jgi:hypothetical protein
MFTKRIPAFQTIGSEFGWKDVLAQGVYAPLEDLGRMGDFSCNPFSDCLAQPLMWLPNKKPRCRHRGFCFGSEMT